MGNNSVPKFIFPLSRFPVYRGSVLGRFYCMYIFNAPSSRGVFKHVCKENNFVKEFRNGTPDNSNNVYCVCHQALQLLLLKLEEVKRGGRKRVCKRELLNLIFV